MSQNRTPARPVVHLELHTADRAAAGAFFARLLQWRPELVRAAAGSYLALELGCGVGGGIVQCCTRRPVWLPYVEVEHVEQVTDDAHELGAAILLEPREGPSGWRSVVSSPCAGDLALWERRR